MATDDIPASNKMDFDRAKGTIVQLAQAGVGGISFSAGEPFLYINEIGELVKTILGNGVARNYCFRLKTCLQT